MASDDQRSYIEAPRWFQVSLVDDIIVVCSILRPRRQEKGEQNRGFNV